MVTENGRDSLPGTGWEVRPAAQRWALPASAAYGAEMLCRTCFTHPRFTEEYGQTAELTLSASCPEAARLLLEHDAPLTLTETDDGGPVVPNDLDRIVPGTVCRAGCVDPAGAGSHEADCRPSGPHSAAGAAGQRLLDEGRMNLSRCWRGGFSGSGIKIGVLSGWRLRSRNGRFFPCWMVLNNMEHLTRRFEAMLDAAVKSGTPPASFRDAFFSSSTKI